MTRPHQIRGNASEAVPTRCVFVDCEACPDPNYRAGSVKKLVIRLWRAAAVRLASGHVTSVREGEGEDGTSFFRWLSEFTSLHSPVWVFAHNLPVDAAWLDLWGEIDRGTLTYEKGILDGPPTFVRCSMRGRGVWFCDTLNWFRCPLADLGDDVGIPKIGYPGDDVPESVLADYCRRDVSIIMEAMTQLIALIRDQGWGQFRATAAGQAWHCWRHQYKGRMPVVHGSIPAYVLERAGYFGGRCDLGFRGSVRPGGQSESLPNPFAEGPGAVLLGERVTVLDARAFYPSVMCDHHFPVRWMFALQNPSLSTVEDLIARNWVMAECLVETDRDVYPRREDGQTIYPVGHYGTVLCGEELRRAVRRGHAKRFGMVSVYQTADLFSDWVMRLWELRCRFEGTGRRAWAAMVKLIANSLGGYFGRYTDKWERINFSRRKGRWGTWLMAHPESGRTCRARAVAGVQEICTGGEPWSESLVSISAAITAAGRCRLADFIEQCPPHTWLYSDTDSLHVTEDAVLAVRKVFGPDTGGMGQLHEKGVYDSAEYRTTKCYRVGDKYCVAGVPQSGELVRPWEWKVQEWESMRQLHQRGPDGSLIVAERILNPTGAYTRGIVDSAGWVAPLRLDTGMPLKPEASEDE